MMGKKNRIKSRINLSIGICAVILLVLEILFAHPHYSNWRHTTPGFELLYGFAGCVLLIVVAKKLLAPILQRPADYYDEKRSKEGGGKHDG